MRKTRVLVVDDSPLIRQIVSDIVRDEPDLEVVGYGRDGQEAVRLVAELKPDVVTMDVEMPRMNGLDALRTIMAATPVPIVMVSTLTAEGTSTTLEALHAGAMDFVCKPNNGAISTIRTMRADLIDKIRQARDAKVGHVITAAPRARIKSVSTDQVVVVASSTGGPRALTHFFESLPKRFPAPILIVQHMPPGFVASLAKRLDSLRTVPCQEAKAGDKVTPGRALMAPAGQHMTLESDGTLVFNDAPSRHGVRPAADYLFESAAEIYGARTIGVVLTGMGRDGAEGAKAIHDKGGFIIAESAETCTIYGMPRATVQLGVVDRELPIGSVAGAVVEAIDSKRAGGRRAS